MVQKEWDILGIKMNYKDYTFTKKEDRTFLMIDMQENFLQRIWEPKRKTMIMNQLNVLKYCAENDMPTILIECESYNQRDYPFPPTIQDITEIFTQIPRKAYLTKKENDAFSNPLLLKQLRKWKTIETYLMGINAEFCVMETAQSAINNKFNIVTAEKLIADAIH